MKQTILKDQPNPTDVQKRGLAFEKIITTAQWLHSELKFNIHT